MGFLFEDFTWPGFIRILILLGVITTLYYIIKMRVRSSRMWKEFMPDYLNQMAKIKSLDYAPSGVITINSAGLVVAWSKGAERIFGYSEEEMLGRQLTTIMPERYRKDHISGLEKVRQTGFGPLIGKTTKVEGLKRNGQEISIKLTLWQWKEGPSTYFTGIVRDVSEEVLLSERETELLATYKEAEDIGNYGVSKWDVLKDIVVYSDGFKAIFNLDKNQSDSVSIIKHIYYEDKPIVESALKKLFEDKKGYEIEYRIVDISGRPKKVRSRTKVILDNNGELQYVIGLIHEIENNGNNNRSPGTNPRE